MTSSHFKYVVVGAGGAGSAAVEEIRRHDAQGSILMVGQERNRPYMRPSLSKEYLRRQKSRQEVSVKPVGWYSDHQIELRTGQRVVHVDTPRRAIAMDNGQEIAFDKLLLAMGASPKPLKIPGADLPNVFYLRSIDDCDRLHHAIDKAKMDGRAHPVQAETASRGRAAVIGSGLLAAEAAASLRQCGLWVELIVERTHPWGKFAGEITGRFLTNYLEQHGVIVHANVSIAKLDGDGRVQRVVLADGKTVECDFAVAAVGIVASRDILRGTPIAAEKAILVDDHCRTSVQDIYAAGDCAAILDPLFGKHRVLDHWESALQTGRIAGANMAGFETKYEGVNSYFSEVFDIRLRAWGESRFVDHRLVRGIPKVDSSEFAEIGVGTDGRISQILAVGRNDEHEAFAELVKRRFNVSGHEDVINDPQKDLRALLG